MIVRESVEKLIKDLESEAFKRKALIETLKHEVKDYEGIISGLQEMLDVEGKEGA